MARVTLRLRRAWASARFGPFLHFGGFNSIPFTYVDNCAEAIVLAGLVSGVEGEIFNVLDDDTPSSRQFLKMYKQNVRLSSRHTSPTCSAMRSAICGRNTRSIRRDSCRLLSIAGAGMPSGGGRRTATPS